MRTTTAKSFCWTSTRLVRACVACFALLCLRAALLSCCLAAKLPCLLPFCLSALLLLLACFASATLLACSTMYNLMRLLACTTLYNLAASTTLLACTTLHNLACVHNLVHLCLLAQPRTILLACTALFSIAWFTSCNPTYSHNLACLLPLVFCLVRVHANRSCLPSLPACLLCLLAKRSTKHSVKRFFALAMVAGGRSHIFPTGDTFGGSIRAPGQGGRSAGGLRGHNVLLPRHHRHPTKRKRGANREPTVYRLYNWKPVFGDNIFGISIGRGLEALKGLTHRPDG